MLFDGEAAFDTIRHLIYEPKETWTPRVHKNLRYLSIFFSVGLENYALIIGLENYGFLGLENYGLEVTSKRNLRRNQ